MKIYKIDHFQTTSQICVCLGPKSGRNGRGSGGRRNRNRENENDFATIDFKFRSDKLINIDEMIKLILKMA